eukprot:1626967-Alexandrium_andersonii.AAC.1
MGVAGGMGQCSEYRADNEGAAGELKDGLWVRIGDEWIVHHRAWRYKLYVPEFTVGGLSRTAITKTRTTTFEYRDGSSQVIQDCWDGEEAEVTSEQPWRGTT